MKNQNVVNYLLSGNKTLGSLFSRLNQLKQWNQWLNDSLSSEPHLKNHCQIVNLLNNSLIAIADSPHWVTRLRFYIPELLPKLRKYPGLENIKAICCRNQPNYQPFNHKKSRPPQLLSAQSAEALLASANKIQDKKLQEILERIARRTADKEE